ncbi:MAG TPA: pantothenate kinase, partial [Clostridiaceae bacterium]|nr:pantothenate kinase [Clostridiaceae bacterium]
MIVGLDIGGSTTKIVALKNDKMIGCLQVRADDPVASAYGAVGKFLNMHKFKVSDVRKLFVTGVGSSFLRQPLLGIETHRVTEVSSIGFGGCFVSGLERAVVVSMGTGTAIVFADLPGEDVHHLIGSGVGGGTILGLARCLLGTRDFNRFSDLSDQGDITAVDLSIDDISRQEIAGLHSEVTASNFGKVVDATNEADIAIGITNLVFQTIGTLAVAVARGADCKDVVYTGNLIHLPSGTD